VSTTQGRDSADVLYQAAVGDFDRYEVVKDIVDECIDLTLNYRQSGHPGGSRSKVHMLLATLLSGAMRWDILRPTRTFGDRGGGGGGASGRGQHPRCDRAIRYRPRAPHPPAT
jgi:hypothetical protein